MLSRGLAVVQRGLAGDTARTTKTSADPLKMLKLQNRRVGRCNANELLSC